MSDSLIKIRPEDPTRINIHQKWEVSFWCNKLHCTESQLIIAVNTVGTSVAAVKAFLHNH